MARSYKILALIAAAASLLAPVYLAQALPAKSPKVEPLSLLSPTEGQVVREDVKIIVPASAIPEGGFLAVLLGDPGQENFVVGLSLDDAVKNSGNLIFTWNTKAGYHDASDPKTEKFLKDGSYSLKVQIHDRPVSGGKVVASGSVGIKLHNRIDRPNPAPGVDLVNKLVFPQSSTSHRAFRCSGLPDGEWDRSAYSRRHWNNGRFQGHTERGRRAADW